MNYYNKLGGVDNDPIAGWIDTSHRLPNNGPKKNEKYLEKWPTNTRSLTDKREIFYRTRCWLSQQDEQDEECDKYVHSCFLAARPQKQDNKNEI